jgi:pilus assembly protein CpaC
VIELRDGQSFAIAGLLQSVTSDTQQQLPWLGDVPILGTLFRSAAFEKKETDLAIIVTPRLVKPAKPGQRLRVPTDDALPASDADRFLTGK